MFANLEIDIDTLPKIEAVNLLPISKSYLKVIILNICIQYTILMVSCILVHQFNNNDIASSIFWMAYFILLIVFSIHIIYSALAFKKRGYALRNHDIIYAHGLLTYKIVTVPIIRIQHLETKQSFIAKQFKLASLYVYTAGESGGDLVIKGLPYKTAVELNQLLTNKIN